MGGSSSKELNEPLMGYKFPTDRAKMRHVRSYPFDEAVHDGNAGMYDYLIIFNKPDEKGVGGLEGTAQQTKDLDRLSWNDIEETWFQAIPGDEDRKNKGVRWLREEWMVRFRTDTVSSAEGGDTIPRATFEGLVREHIIDVLGRKAGLQLSLRVSTKGDRVYCLVRAPESLLELKADRIKYKLKFRGEVDPGFDFWSRWADHDMLNRPVYVELREDSILYDKNKANEILEDLYGAGKIGANDAAVMDVEEPTKKHWSRRIHALERIADKVPVSNEYPAYAEFSTNRRERHLFEEYQSARGRTLFLPKDRLYLTRRLIDEQFDFGVLVENEVVVACFALHDASRGEPTLNVTWFLRHWVLPWGLSRSTADQLGAPAVSHPAIERGVVCPVYLWPWAQPLVEIRAYFGEKIALYFAWVGFYGYSLLIPAIAGFGCEMYLLLTGNSDESRGIHVDQIFLGFFLVAWAAYYKESWDVESRYAAAKWGTINFEEVEQDRPQFVGDPDQPRRLSPITNQNETYYPDEKRTTMRCCSALVVFVLAAVLLLIVLLIFYVQNLVLEAGYGTVALLFSVVQAGLVSVFSFVYTKVAYFLNDQENYRTQTDYENNLILKKFFFEVFNNYSALAITAFFKSTYFECIAGSQNCLGDLKVLLISMAATRYVIAVYKVLASGIGTILGFGGGGEHGASDSSSSSLLLESTPNPLLNNSDIFDEEVELGAIGEEHKDGALHDLDTPRFEAEIALDEYEGTFDDYAEIVLQMGLVTMFSLGFYALPLTAMLETLLQIRGDAYNLTALTRRPDPNLAETVGSWGSLMDAMGLLAVFSNAGIICFTTSSMISYTFLQKLLAFFVLEQLMLACKMATKLSVSRTPVDLYEIIKRQQFVVNRHKNVVFDYEDEEKDEEDEVGKKRGHVDRDNLKTSAVKQAALGPVELKQIKFLNDRLKDCDADMKVARSEFKRASRSEILNDELGVSYSRRAPDLALGMLTLTILEAENVGTRHNRVDAKNCRLVVHIRDATPRNERKYDGQPGPSPQVSKPARLPPKTPGLSSEVLNSGARLVFNQTFSLAPIKTSKAEVFIEIMDESKRIKLGTTTLMLTDLSNQQKQSLTLSIAKSMSTGEAAVLYVKAHFQFSKIIPIKRRIYAIKDEQRKLARDIQNIRLGNPIEQQWDFPDFTALSPRPQGEAKTEPGE
ncbi:hypothetical protein CTAYLR_003599 [Chrysophaeum taylorii]|uniref:Anoctamin transmembrane domain-containing protein n=1 Tax=Chrysophaeum taylorii TaxID=2483200 RepID=A0AAD7XT34_9STRA|nr:hypothetical protein CTAYLR_003599 [Chrysophaeum taylorii]